MELHTPNDPQRPANEADTENTEALAQALAPADRGKDALSFLFGAFVMEAVFWGESPKRKKDVLRTGDC